MSPAPLLDACDDALTIRRAWAMTHEGESPMSESTSDYEPRCGDHAVHAAHWVEARDLPRGEERSGLPLRRWCRGVYSLSWRGLAQYARERGDLDKERQLLREAEKEEQARAREAEESEPLSPTEWSGVFAAIGAELRHLDEAARRANSPVECGGPGVDHATLAHVRLREETLKLATRKLRRIQEAKRS